MKFECLKCGLVLDVYSRPHFADKHEKPHRTNLRLLGNWSRYEDIPKSLRSFEEVCWGTVVSTPKYNRPV